MPKEKIWKKIWIGALALTFALSCAACFDSFGDDSGNSSSLESSRSSDVESSSDDIESNSGGGESSSGGEESSSGGEESSSGGEEKPAETCTVTFVDGESSTTRTVEKGASLTEIPDVGVKKGYTAKWDRTDFSSIDSDLTVTCVYTANAYTIYLKASSEDVYEILDVTEIEVTFDGQYTIPDAERWGYTFVGWVLQGDTARFDKSGVYNAYDNDVTLVAVWEKDDTSERWTYSPAV